MSDHSKYIAAIWSYGNIDLVEFVDLRKQYLALHDSINARIRAVLDHGRFILGPEVGELEERLSALTGAEHCITCASGTDALLISLLALGIGPGDEVITTPFTFVATAEMIALIGARPVFVDIQPDACNLDPQRIRDAITDRTKAILPVSLYGQPADMDEINAIADGRGLPVIEDAAQSFGAAYKGRSSCNLTTIGCTSFFPSKPLGCYGDGGAIFTNDDALARAMREIRVHGQEGRYCHARIGIGGRMDTLQCAITLAKLERFPWEVARRQALGRRYSELLACEDIEVPHIKPDRTSVYAQYTLQVDHRDCLRDMLATAGIPTAVHYPRPLHQQPAYRKYHQGNELSVSERVAMRVISLPMYPDMDEVTQDRIVAAVKDSVARDGSPRCATRTS